MGRIFPLPEHVGDALDVHDSRTVHVMMAWSARSSVSATACSAGGCAPALRALSERLNQLADQPRQMRLAFVRLRLIT
jgi:hypothetical protein